jgi:hypothetical protein
MYDLRSGYNKYKLNYSEYEKNLKISFQFVRSLRSANIKIFK